MAELIVDLGRLRRNLRVVRGLCRSRALDMVGVVKGVHRCLPIIEAFQEEGVMALGVSRVADAIGIASSLRTQPLLLGVPPPQELDPIPRWCATSYHSELSTIQRLAHVAADHGLLHGIVLVVDNGDLREGLPPEQVLATARQVLSMQPASLRLVGLAATLGCCSGTLPDAHNLGLLDTLAAEIEDELGHRLETISVGGSVILDWLEREPLPARINQVRIGEAILLGTIPSVGRAHPDLFQDVFRLSGRVVEVKEKEAIPPGMQGADAFGRKPVFRHSGIRRRAILDFGVADTHPWGLTSRLERLEVVASNSDYTVVDVTDCPGRLRVGDPVEFTLDYAAMIQTFLSPFVPVVFVDQDGAGR